MVSKYGLVAVFVGILILLGMFWFVHGGNAALVPGLLSMLYILGVGFIDWFAILLIFVGAVLIAFE